MSAIIDMMEDGFRLPKVLDMLAAAPLLEAFMDRRGNPLVVDGSEVERLGGQCLQILLAARAAWAADDESLVLERCSDDLRAALATLGASPEALIHHKELAP